MSNSTFPFSNTFFSSFLSFFALVLVAFAFLFIPFLLALAFPGQLDFFSGVPFNIHVFSYFPNAAAPESFDEDIQQLESGERR